MSLLSLFSSSRTEMSDDETSSHSSQSSLSIDDENMPENAIWLYQFEPEFSSCEESVEVGGLEGASQHDDENFRIRNLYWCGFLDIFCNLNNAI